MIRRTSKAKMIQRLKKLESIIENKKSIPTVLNLEQWLNSNDKSSSFGEYVLKYEKKNPNSTIIIDDMILQTDMYINTEPILYSDKETLKLFINLAMEENEIEYMKEFIKLFEDSIGIEEREEISKLSSPFYLDFFDHYKKISVEELVQRYKDQSFFEPLPIRYR